jgi:Acetyltransferase (GNAT) domain
MHDAQNALWCKSSRQNMVFRRRSKNTGKTISFRSFAIDTDLPLVHGWVNQEYTRAFWQMRGSVNLLRSCYQCILQNPFAHSFIGMLDEHPVCQFDIYKVSVDELARHVLFDEQDCGFHLCMAPVETPVHGLSTELIQTFLEYYFAQESTGSMFAEPDVENIKSIHLLEKAGFTRINTIGMSYKTAHVYQLTKTNFLCQE